MLNYQAERFPFISFDIPFWEHKQFSSNNILMQLKMLPCVELKRNTAHGASSNCSTLRLYRNCSDVKI